MLPPHKMLQRSEANLRLHHLDLERRARMTAALRPLLPGLWIRYRFM